MAQRARHGFKSNIKGFVEVPVARHVSILAQQGSISLEIGALMDVKLEVC